MRCSCPFSSALCGDKESTADQGKKKNKEAALARGGFESAVGLLTSLIIMMLLGTFFNISQDPHVEAAQGFRYPYSLFAS